MSVEQLQSYYELFLEYMNSGGFVMWALFVCVILLWYGMGYRYHVLNRGSLKSVRNLIRKIKKGKRTKVKGLIDAAIVEAIDVLATSKQKGIKEHHELRDMLDDSFYKYRQESARYAKLVRTIVVLAPLIGLLGTVIGMIETFDSLASMALFSQSGGIAGGISQALFTTQMGLVVAVPGVIIGRFLDKKANTIELELEQIKDIMISEEM